MNVHAAGDLKTTGLTHPNGAPLRLNTQDFVAIDRDKNAKFEATYRPQALYNRANEGFHANNETFLLHEVATNLPIYRPDTGPTDFHLHLPPGGFQLVLVTSGAFTFDYDGRFYNVGPGAVMLQSAIVHRQLFYTWSGLSTEENLKTPQTVVPDPISMGYSGKFLEAFITDPTTFPNPTIVGPDQINEAETPRVAWSHPLHDRPADGGFWLQDPLALDALFKPLVDSPVKSALPVYVRDIGIEIPSGHLVAGHIIATDPRGHSLLPKSTSIAADADCFAKGEVVIYRVIRGTAEFKKKSGESFELSAGDVVTAGKDSISLDRRRRKHPGPTPRPAQGHERATQLDADAARRDRRPRRSDHHAQGHSSAAHRRQAGRVSVRVARLKKTARRSGPLKSHRTQ